MKSSVIAKSLRVWRFLSFSAQPRVGEQNAMVCMFAWRSPLFASRSRLGVSHSLPKTDS